MDPLLEEPRRISDAYYFDPDETLITDLKRAVLNSQDILLEQEGNGRLLVLGSRHEYFSQLNDEEDFFSAQQSAVKVTPLLKNDRLIPAANVIGRNVDELMWKVAFHSSQGRLMKGCYPVDVIELTRWPNLTRLPHTANTPRIASLLSRQPSSLAIAGKVLKVSPQEMYQFYSAAHCAGVARPLNRTLPEPQLEPHRQRGLLAALWERLTRP